MNAQKNVAEAPGGGEVEVSLALEKMKKTFRAIVEVAENGFTALERAVQRLPTAGCAASSKATSTPKLATTLAPNPNRAPV